jgi:DNA polymerase-3 subunit delta
MLGPMASELKPVYLLGGTDRPKIDRARARLRARFDADAVERLDANEATGDDAVAACNALGLFAGGGRLILVTSVEKWKAGDVKALAAYLKAPAPDTVLALVADDLKRDSPLAKACAAAGELLVYEVSKRDLPRWVLEQFQRVGADATRDAAAALIELVGDDLQELAAEIEKVAAWAGGEERIEAEHVAAVVVARAETPAFALTDAWGRRDVAGLLGATEAMLEHASDPRRELTRLVALLASHVDRVRRCQLLDAEGVPPKDAAVKLKRHRFYVEKLYAQARNYSVDELRHAVVTLARLDHALKGGSKLPGELELDRALVETVRGPPNAAAPAAA